MNWRGEGNQKIIRFVFFFPLVSDVVLISEEEFKYISNIPLARDVLMEDSNHPILWITERDKKLPVGL